MANGMKKNAHAVHDDEDVAVAAGQRSGVQRPRIAVHF